MYITSQHVVVYNIIVLYNIIVSRFDPRGHPGLERQRQGGAGAWRERVARYGMGGVRGDGGALGGGGKR